MSLERLWPLYGLLLVLCFVFMRCEAQEKKGQEVGEEVSIEAVEADDSEKVQNIAPRRDAVDDMDRHVAAPPGGTQEVVVDNSTAVATVYPDVGKTLSSNSSSIGNGTNVNATVTTRYQRVKVSCSQFLQDGDNSTLEEGKVDIVNMTHLLHGLLVTNPTIKARSTPSNCTVVLFFTHWCPWSAKAAPHFNALPRAFRNIRFAAIDSSIHTAINTYFGILSVPSMVLFYNGKILAKFNDTTFNVNQFAEFISTFTDQKPGIRLNVTSTDFLGPVPSVITKGPDWYLYLSWIFIIACFFYYMSKTTIWLRILELIQNSWREAEAVASVPPHHFHQD